MTAHEILERFAQVVDYDPERRRFNLLSNEYVFHRACKSIAAITSDYDPSGAVGVLYAKGVFLSQMKDSRVSVLDVIEHPEGLSDIRDMYDIFTSADAIAIEQGFLTATDRLVAKITGKAMLGEMDPENSRQLFVNALDSIMNELSKCREDVYMKGGPIKAVTNFLPMVLVYDRLGECVLDLEKKQDGLYLCYIAQGGTSDGYFGFFLKSNGNLLSVNDRVNEAYMGQHSQSRNGRWKERAATTLFPYEHILNFGGYDYKGYAKEYTVDESKLRFSDMKPEGYIPIILSMVMLTQKYTGATLKSEPVLISSLLPQNLPKILGEERALAVVRDSAIAAHQQDYQPAFRAEQVLDTQYGAERFKKDSTRCWDETGAFPCLPSTQLFIDLYGAGFQYDATSVFRHPDAKALPKGAPNQPYTPDFVGTRNRMDLQAWYDARCQLAEYIRDRMYEEYTQFGGIDAVKEWFRKTCTERVERFTKCCAAAWKLKKGEHPAGFTDQELEVIKATFEYESDYAYASVELTPRMLCGRRTVSYCELKPGVKCNVFYIFQPRLWTDIETIFQVPVPKIVQGWYAGEGMDSERKSAGNELLEATDAVAEVGTPFERNEVDINPRYNPYIHRKRPVYAYCPTSTLYRFSVSQGFSKSGLNMVAKTL